MCATTCLYSPTASYLSSLPYVYTNATLCRSVACVLESGSQSSRDYAPAAAAAEATGGRGSGDVDHSTEVLPHSPNYGGRCRGDVDHSAEVPPPSAIDGAVNVNEASTSKRPSSPGHEDTACASQTAAATLDDCGEKMALSSGATCSGSSLKDMENENICMTMQSPIQADF